MSCCIITIIKNEHQYLDEWIQYHLDIGVSHIFIFEDIDSSSHREITDKYNRVTLLPISSLLSSEEKSEILMLKRTKKQNPQHIYFSKALLYVQSLQEYNWAFQIDIDEFITLENKDDYLDDIMSQFNSYDALLLQWKCYGASGYIRSPNYKEGGVQELFDEPAPEHTLSSPYPDSWSKRIIYNLQKYQSGFFHCVHQAKDICNFCNTRFERDRKSWCYDKIYLRHYITRSWEEYLWKKLRRGYFMGFARTWDAFFVLNPEMSNIKKDLIYAINHPVLVVLPYVQSKSQGSELRLALRGWRKNCKFSYHFVVIGEFDTSLVEEFDWVEFIAVPTLPRVNGQYNPHLDIQHKFEVAYERFKDHYPGFIYMVDDNYAVRPFSQFDIFQTHYLQSSFIGVERLPASYWKHDKWKTRRLLDREGLPHVNYTTHFPCYFNFEKLKMLWDKFDMRHESYVPEDVYFNAYYFSRPVQVDPVRYGIWGPTFMDERFNNAIENTSIKFICNSVEGWSKELEDSLKKIVEGV